MEHFTLHDRQDTHTIRANAGVSTGQQFETKYRRSPLNTTDHLQ